GDTEDITNQTLKRSEIILKTIQLSNIALKLQGYYITNGHVKSEEEVIKAHTFARSVIPSMDLKGMTFFEKIYFYQANYWYSFILQNFERSIQMVNSSIELFKAYPKMLIEDKDLYVKLLHQHMKISYQEGNLEALQKKMAYFDFFLKEHDNTFSPNSRLNAHLYFHFSKLNELLLSKQYLSGDQNIPQIADFLKKNFHLIDAHKKMIFYYKFAGIKFLLNKADQAIPYLNKIINSKDPHLREDIQIFSRLMFLMAHYEMKNYDLLIYLIKSYKTFFSKTLGLDPLQQATFEFFKKAAFANLEQKSIYLMELHKEVISLKSNHFLRRSFHYLDVEKWTSGLLKHSN
ncbi:MAG: hypothetical protein AAFO07_27145, partial [Bacteroidota bacterium]